MVALRFAVFCCALVAIGVPASRVLAQELAPIRVGTPGADANAQVYYANDMGFFRKAGLDAQITKIGRGTGSAVSAAVVGGALDIGEGDLVAIVNARLHGIPITVLAPSAIYSSNAPTSALIVAKDGPIKMAADLDGKTIGVLSLEGPAKVATASWIEKNGGHLNTIKFVEMAATEMGGAVDRGAIAAGALNEPALSASLERNRVLANCYDAIGRRWFISAWFATTDWVKKNPALAKKFADAMRESAQWANQTSNHPRSAEILAKYSGIPAATISRASRATYGETFDPALAQPLIDAAAKYKSLERAVNAAELVAP